MKKMMYSMLLAVVMLICMISTDNELQEVRMKGFPRLSGTPP